MAPTGVDDDYLEVLRLEFVYSILGYNYWVHLGVTVQQCFL